MSSIQAAKAAMHYVGIAPEPRQCRACLYGASAHQAYAGRYHCAKGGFFVAATAGCAAWQAKPSEVAA